MALPANWFFGGKNSDEQLGQMGGFTLGGFESPFAAPASTVATPSAGVAGSAPGQPPSTSPTGGMDALSVPFDQPSSGPSAEPTSDPGNANVTGFNGDLANTFGTIASLGLPGIPALGMLGNLGFGAARAMGMSTGLNAFGNSMTDSMGNPVNYSGNTFGVVPTGTLRGVDINAMDPNPVDPFAPSLPQSFDVPSVSPNMANFANPDAPGIFALGNPNPANIPPAKGSDNDPDAPTGPPGPVSTDPSEGMSNSGPTGHGPGGPGAGAGPGSGAAGASGGAPGAGDAGGGSAGSGGTGAGASAGDKRGGVVGQERARQRGQRPDARMLAAKLQRGAKVDVGKRANVDSVPVHLARGEYVVNRASTQRNLPELERINRSAGQPTGRGGFAVGHPREARR
jgi:hypothetical protein